MKKDLLILLLLITPAFAPLFQRGYFSMHDDLQSMRQFQMDKCFTDGQIPCRWTSDLGYGFGYPLFNYYPPLPYLVGQIYRAFGFQYIDTVKLVGITGFILTSVFMYLLGKEFWGRGGGLIASAFYTYAPYHSVDFYVRGAINEFWAMAFYPLIFWTTYRVIKETSGVRYWITWTSIGVAGLMLSHNPMLMIFAPVLILWCLFWLIKFRSIRLIRSIRNLLLSAIFALGLSAFFTLPVVFESKFVSLWTLTSGYFNYLAHFLNWRQILLFINWGYGSSELGPADSMSFALGYLHWIAPLIILISTFLLKKFADQKYLILLLLLFTMTSLFMSHSKSTFIWQAVKPLEFLQFPWRFLTLAVFSASFLSGSIANILSRKFLSLLLLLLLLLNANYFRPREWYPDMTDAKKFSGKSWQLLVTSGIFDYLPKWAPAPPADARGSEINITSGQGIFTPLLFQSNRQEYLVTMAEPGQIELQTYFFPGWKYYIGGEEVKNYKLDPLLGRPQIDLSSGRHELVAVFTDTPIRTFANLLSVVSWALVLSIMILWMLKSLWGMWIWPRLRLAH